MRLLNDLTVDYRKLAAGFYIQLCILPSLQGIENYTRLHYSNFMASKERTITSVLAPNSIWHF